MGKGGGGSQATQEFKPPAHTQPYWEDYLTGVASLTSSPYIAYGGQRVAEINPTQAAGMQRILDLAGSSSADEAAMRRNMQLTMNGAIQNPYANMQTNTGWNPLIGQGLTGNDPMTGEPGTILQNPYVDTQNRFKGFGPMYQQMKNYAMNDVVQNFQQAIAPQTEAAFNRAGAFDGGAHLAQQKDNASALARELNRMSSEMDQSQWNTSGQLDATDLARMMAGQQAYANYYTDAHKWNLEHNANLIENNLNRAQQAQMFDLSRSTNAWDQERQRQMGMMPYVMQANQGDMANAQAMLSVGDMQRSYVQDLLNQRYGNWQENQNYPFQMADILANALARASGNYGTNTGFQSSPYTANPYSALLGAGLLGGAAYSAM